MWLQVGNQEARAKSVPVVQGAARQKGKPMTVKHLIAGAKNPPAVPTLTWRLGTNNSGDLRLLAHNGSYESIVLVVSTDGELHLIEGIPEVTGLQIDKAGRIKIAAGPY